MSTTSAPEQARLSILDLSPIPPGTDAGEPIRAAIELAQAAEELGYLRYWFGEHHLGPGRSGASPAVLSALVAQETDRIRLGSAVAVLPNYSPLALVEQFGTIAALHPGRVTIGLGRGQTYQGVDVTPDVAAVLERLRRDPRQVDPEERLLDLDVTRYNALARSLLRVDPFEPDQFRTDVYEVLGLLERRLATLDGVPVHAAPGFGLGIDVALFGWTAGPSARLAGELGLPYVANAHNNAFPLVENVQHYREHFRPSPSLAEPYVAVSTQVLVGETAAEAERLGAAYPRWISQLGRRGFAVSAERDPAPYAAPTPEAQESLDAALGLRIIGDPDHVVGRLSELSLAAAADELIVHSFTADTDSRRRSYELLGQAWRSARASSRPELIALR